MKISETTLHVRNPTLCPRDSSFEAGWCHCATAKPQSLALLGVSTSLISENVLSEAAIEAYVSERWVDHTRRMVAEWWSLALPKAISQGFSKAPCSVDLLQSVNVFILSWSISLFQRLGPSAARTTCE